jgi:hypothetical protein
MRLYHLNDVYILLVLYIYCIFQKRKNVYVDPLARGGKKHKVKPTGGKGKGGKKEAATEGIHLNHK